MGISFYIQTFGCQANEADSEYIAGLLLSAGLTSQDNSQKADWVIINSCVVRQSAEDRIDGLILNLAKQKHLPKIFLTGCIHYHNRQFLEKRFPQVDYFVRIADWFSFLKEKMNLPVQANSIRKRNKQSDWALIPIMEGCNNFCSYCLVPYARGREVSRSQEEVLQEVRQAIKNGYRKILLLGQNVNSYQGTAKKKILSSFKTPLAVLLERLNKLEGLKKISFLTSNPWDFTDDIIKAMKLPKIVHQLHLPLQSGDDDILRKMNRPYTALQYIEVIRKVRQAVPDVEISTDIIVGFPGETKKNFQNTVKLCQRIGFSKAYVNKYSPRPKTLAGRKFIDNVAWAEKKRRWHILNQLINQ